MSNDTAKVTLESSVKQATDNKPKERPVTVTLLEDQIAVILNSDTMAIVERLFTTQDNYSNESKYIRVFMHTAAVMCAKQECRRLVNEWENAITKENKLHPTWSRERAEQELLESKKMQQLKARVDVAVSLLKTEFK